MYTNIGQLFVHVQSRAILCPFTGQFVSTRGSVWVWLQIRLCLITGQVTLGKSPGIDGIPAEGYQYMGEEVLEKLQDLFANCWEKGTLLQGCSH